MFITKAALQRERANAWDQGYSFGFLDGDADAEWARDGAMGYRRGPEPVPAPNPYRKEGT